MNKLWSTALLAAARNLRQDVLKGQLWGSPTSTPTDPPFESPYANEDADEDEDTPQSKLRNKQRTPFYSTTSASTPNLGGRSNNGRVKGMIENFEGGQGHAGRERSGSNTSSSSGSAFDEHAEDEDAESKDREIRDRPLPTPPPRPTPRTFAAQEVFARPQSEEPSIEELLRGGGAQAWEDVEGGTMKHVRSSDEPRAGGLGLGLGGSRSRKGGVHAWEEDDSLGATVKHIPRHAVGVEDVFSASTAAAPPEGDEARNSQHLAELKELEDRRIELEDLRRRKDAELEALRSIQSERLATAKQATAEYEHALATARAEGRKEAEAQMAGTLRESRSLIDNFRQRLEQVERKVNDMHAAHAEASKIQHIAVGVGPDSADPPSSLTQLDPRFFFKSLFARLFAPDDSAIGTSRRGRRRLSYLDLDLIPKTVSALPSYVILVGLGVCAVVFRVLVKRGAGVLAGRRR